MKKLWFGLLLALLIAPQSPARDSYKLEKNDTLEKVYQVAPGTKPTTVRVDNVFGSITVSGAPITEVRLKVKKTLGADSEDGLKKAANEVKLNIAEKDGLLDIFVDGPFRHDGCHRESDPEYSARYDFELQVPERADLVLKTITDGDIVVRDSAGSFTVRNVNGNVEMESIKGGGSGQTVNGHVHAAFRKDPAAACCFKTVNGDVKVRLAPGLAADFRVKTFNGGVYSDLPVSCLPSLAQAPRQGKGHPVYRSPGYQNVRVGGGGREITLDTLNGDIVIAGSPSK